MKPGIIYVDNEKAWSRMDPFKEFCEIHFVQEHEIESIATRYNPNDIDILVIEASHDSPPIPPYTSLSRYISLSEQFKDINPAITIIGFSRMERYFLNDKLAEKLYDIRTTHTSLERDLREILERKFQINFEKRDSIRKKLKKILGSLLEKK